MQGRWKLWVAGIALGQLLVIGVDVAILWPEPCEAEQFAARLRVGMTESEVLDTAGDLGMSWGGTLRVQMHHRLFDDGSSLTVAMCWSGRRGEDRRVGNFEVIPPTLVHPLTRLRRTLARSFPLLGE
jgi:hypothetical protein